MIDTKEFEDMRKELEKADEDREETIRTSRDIIKLSKQAIYATHRGQSADELISGMQDKLAQLEDIPMARTARQEYVEAYAYLHFMKENNLITKEKTGVDTESYLLGLCDLTGELVRKAVNEVINKNTEVVYTIKDLVSQIYAEMLKFDLRNSELRKKSDSIKWNLSKVEDIIYNLELRSR
ncbi:MAG: translin family protein [Nanobdellota archaeon]